MKLIIHRGAKEIGGSCVEIQSGDSRILIDFGMPLVDKNKERFDSASIAGKSIKELKKLNILPNINGLYKGENPEYNAILLSHPHQDHYGLLSFVNSDIPVYLSKGCKELIEVSNFFGQTEYDLKNIKTVEMWKPFQAGDFTITPYLVDHSGFDALAFLVESENKKIFYSGDFRGHGRKSIVFDNILRNPPKGIDCLILEGTMIGRDKGEYLTEEDVENGLINILKNENKLFFVACSSQNIDRLVSIYKACAKSGRIFVIDPYTAFILDKLKGISSNIPQSTWDDTIRIFFVPSRYTEKMAGNKSLFKFKSAKITYEQMQGDRERLLIKDSYLTRTIFAKKKGLSDSKLIYSMWDGYLQNEKPFWDQNNVPIIEIHASGHAYIKDLQEFVKALNPKYIIPNHTFYPEKFEQYFGSNVRIVKDGEPFLI
jgi:ribonuclease J